MLQLTFLSDALFKYSFGKNNHQSYLLRQFLLQEIVNESYLDIQVMNPELIPETILQKNVILDILLENKDIRIGIDMQATSFNIHLYKRFQQYLSRLCSDQLTVGSDYACIKPAIMILFIKDLNMDTPSLIVEMTMLNKEYNVPLPYPLQKLIIVQLPYIEIIAKQKKKLSEFEAMIYMIYKDTLDGIEYDKSIGVIKIMKEKRERFMATGMYDSALQRQYFTIDYDLMLKETKEESKRLGINQGVLKEKKDNIMFLIRTLYNEDASLWIENYSLEQLDYIKILCFKNISYKELLEMKDKKNN